MVWKVRDLGERGGFDGYLLSWGYDTEWVLLLASLYPNRDGQNASTREWTKGTHKCGRLAGTDLWQYRLVRFDLLFLVLLAYLPPFGRL